jgi:hypothetical protein
MQIIASNRTPSALLDSPSQAAGDTSNRLAGGAPVEIKQSRSQPSGIGPAEYFTGTVRIDPLFEAPAPARVFGASVTFDPGARTAWHSHPLGQTLIVRYVWSRLGPALGRAEGENPTWGCRLVSARREALARSHCEHGHDPHRHRRTSQRQKRRLDGKGLRRPVPGLIASLDHFEVRREFENAKAPTWKERLGGIGDRPRLHGTELRMLTPDPPSIPLTMSALRELQSLADF